MSPPISPPVSPLSPRPHLSCLTSPVDDKLKSSVDSLASTLPVPPYAEKLQSSSSLYVDDMGHSSFSKESCQEAQSAPVEWKPQKQEYMVMLTISIISLMVALDATILVPVLPALATALNGTATDAFWAGTSYLMACAVFQPFIASLADIFG